MIHIFFSYALVMHDKIIILIFCSKILKSKFATDIPTRIPRLSLVNALSSQLVLVTSVVVF